MANKVFDEIDELNINEAVQFARMLEEIEQPSDAAQYAKSLIHFRIDDLLQQERDAKTAMVYWSLRHRFRNRSV